MHRSARLFTLATPNSFIASPLAFNFTLQPPISLIRLHPPQIRVSISISMDRRDRRWRRSPGSWDKQRHGRPPPPLHPPGPVYIPVPAWEKEFCASCSVPWRKLCHTKEIMSIPIYKNVVEWDDSAAIDAFHAAKARFWAKINRMPCNIPLPDPSMYIDKIDYDAVIDPKLITDLENEYVSNIDEQYNADDPVASSGDAAEQNSVNWDKFIPRNETASWIAKHNSDSAWKSGGASHLRDFVNGWGSGDWEHGREVHPWENGMDSSWRNCHNQNNSWGGGWKNKNTEMCGQKRNRDNQCYQGGKYRANNRWSDNRENKRAMYSSQPLSMR